MVLRLAQRGAQRAGGTGLAAGLEAQATPEEEAPVRSRHRHVIQARLKKAGAAWLPDHADQIAHLRVLRANNQWLPLWNEPHPCLTAPRIASRNTRILVKSRLMTQCAPREENARSSVRS